MYPDTFSFPDVPSSSHKTTTTIVPVSTNSGNNSNIFAKIGRLNEALQAINPRYQPIGFSITSMESCSPGVLQDALVAAETGVFTILSVIGKYSNLKMNYRKNKFPFFFQLLDKKHNYGKLLDQHWIKS